MDASGSAYEIEREGDAVVVTPLVDMSELKCLEFEHNFQQLERELRLLLEQLENRAEHIVIDFRKTNYFGSSAIGLFVRLWKLTKSYRGHIAFCGLSSLEAEILHVAKLDSLWPIYATRAAALEAIKAGLPAD